MLPRYPELPAWQGSWTDGQHRLYRDIHALARACRPALHVGWHVFHTISFSPFHGAGQGPGELSRHSAFIKPVAYNNGAGPRFHTWVDACRASFADATPAATYPFLARLLGVGEGIFDDLPRLGFSGEYARREAERALVAVEGRCAIYPGIDIATPTGPEPAHRSREGVERAVLAALASGAHGVVPGRECSGMQLGHPAGADDAPRELSRPRPPATETARGSSLRRTLVPPVSGPRSM